MGEDGGRQGVLSQGICHCFQWTHLLPTVALGGEVAVEPYQAFSDLFSEII